MLFPKRFPNIYLVKSTIKIMLTKQCLLTFRNFNFSIYWMIGTLFGIIHLIIIWMIIWVLLTMFIVLSLSIRILILLFMFFIVWVFKFMLTTYLIFLLFSFPSCLNFLCTFITYCQWILGLRLLIIGIVGVGKLLMFNVLWMFSLFFASRYLFLTAINSY